MPYKQNIAFAQLFWDILNHKTGELGKVEYMPQKPHFDFDSPVQKAFPRSAPEEQGVSSRLLADMVEELKGSSHVGLHQLMVLRHGTVIYEAGFDPYQAGVWHAAYSMSKSLVSMAIGLLADEGKLSVEDYVMDILEGHPGVNSILNRMKYRSLTVQHLLTMTSGVSFNEMGAVSGNDWLKAFFDASAKVDPGVEFDYNSMNTFVLSAIVTQLAGKSCFAYLQEKLFEPMGITKIFWEASPTGITKGGWGLFITPEDAAKLGQLYLQKGMWNGQQLISEEWIAASTRGLVETDRADNAMYGYQIWVGPEPRSFMYNGMLGQNVRVYRSLDMIIVTNAGNDEVFAEGSMTTIIDRYIHRMEQELSEVPLPGDPVGIKRLGAAALPQTDMPRIPRGGWGREKAYSKSPSTLLRILDGQAYEMKSRGVGIFPLLLQVVHNNFTNGIRMIRFHYQKGSFSIELQEGEDIYQIPVGFGRSRHTTININGEPYLIGSKASVGVNEDNEYVLKVTFAFIEEACARTLKIVLHSEDRIELRWSETPGNAIITDTLGSITVGAGSLNGLLGGILSQISPELLKELIKGTIDPVVAAERISSDNTGNMTDNVVD